MKIINIVPGFGGTFYCGNCLRDSGFVHALKAAGHDAITLPIYLPLFAEGCKSEEEIPVFYGAVNIYLKQNYKLFRHMPSWMESLLDSEPILRYAAKKAGSTRAHGLEEMTMSMLRGHEGYQKDELQQLINYLQNHEKPDVVHLSNALLLGLAYKIRTELGIPVVCSLQDEDVWIDAMDESYIPKLWKLLSEKAKDVDAFIPVSNYFAGVMKHKMNIPEEKLHPIYISVDPDNYEVTRPSLNPPVIGYLNRINDENGFEILIDAFIELKDQSEFKNTKLKVTGGKSGDDKPFINKQLKKLKQKNYIKDIEFVDDFRVEALSEFFSTLTVLSVPVLKGEAFGLYQLQSLAAGVPLVQPALGAFPEIIKETGGGVVYEPNTAEALAAKYSEVFSDPDKLNEMSVNGRKAVEDKFNMKILTEKMIEVYANVTSGNA